jgi:hypothetical protein
MTQEKALQALHSENERLDLYKDAYAQCTWVGLTDEEVDDIANSILTDDPVLWWRKLSQAIEAKLKEKNT